jgi:hypothetical protein
MRVQVEGQTCLRLLPVASFVSLQQVVDDDPRDDHESAEALKGTDVHGTPTTPRPTERGPGGRHPCRDTGSGCRGAGERLEMDVASLFWSQYRQLLTCVACMCGIIHPWPSQKTSSLGPTVRLGAVWTLVQGS